MVILIDMDGVIVDIEAGIVKWWQKLGYGELPFEPGERTSFSMIAQSHEHEDAVRMREIMSSEGFFESLEPIEGAIEAVNQLREQHEVYILTSAGVTLPFAASEKYRWIDSHFDKKLLSRLVITPSKHIVKGAVLIDDKPMIANEDEAEWEHILFDSSYNREVPDQRRLNWKNYKEVLDI